MSAPTNPVTPDGPTQDRGFTLDKRRRWPVVLLVVLVVAIVVALVASRSGGDESSPYADKSKELVVSTFEANVAEVELIDYIRREVAPKHGIKIKFKGISDSTQLNRAVSTGEVAGTIYQHKFWLDQVLEANPDFKEVAATPTFRWGFGIWSTRHDDLADLPDGATVTLPSDPANEAYAIYTLAEAGLVTLKPGTKPETATQKDIASNPKNLKFKLIEYTAQARSLDDVDAAVSYTEVFAIAKIDAKHEIYEAPTPDAFVGQLTVGSDFVDDEAIQALIATFKDPAVQEYLKNGQDGLDYKLQPLDNQ